MRRGSILGSWNLNYHQRIRVNTARAGPYSVKLVAKCARELGMEVVRCIIKMREDGLFTAHIFGY